MADVVYVLIIVAFFALAALYVKACEAIIGSDVVAPGDRREIEPAPLAA